MATTLGVFINLPRYNAADFSTNNAQYSLSQDTFRYEDHLQSLIRLLEGVGAGAVDAQVKTILQTRGTASIVNASVIVNITNNTTLAADDVLTIGGKALTARASGAVANEFNKGADANATAVAIAAAINLTTNQYNGVYAVAGTGLVTIFANVPGAIGNLISVSRSEAAGGSWDVAGGASAFMSGGTGPDGIPVSYQAGA